MVLHTQKNHVDYGKRHFLIRHWNEDDKQLDMNAKATDADTPTDATKDQTMTHTTSNQQRNTQRQTNLPTIFFDCWNAKPVSLACGALQTCFHHAK